MMNRMLAVMMPLALVGPPVVAGAQTPDSTALQAGDRVRFRASTMPTAAVGEVIDAEPDVLRIWIPDEADSIAVPRSAITRLERSVGMRRNTVKGAGVGALVGAVSGVMFILIEAGTPCDDELCRGLATFFGAAGAGAGAIVGAGIGAAQKREHWEAIPIGRAAVGVRLVPERRGAGLALSVGF